MAEKLGRWGEFHHSVYDTATVDGDVAGDIAVAGIKVGDTLVSVQNVAAAGANLVDEFNITDTDTINNAGGTDTTGMVLLVIWQSAEVGLTG